MEEDPRVWLPKNAEITVDEQARRASLRVRLRQGVRLGHVPAGWTVELRGQVQGIEAETVGEGARLIVNAGTSGRPVTVAAPFQTIGLGGRRTSHVALTRDGLLVLVGARGASVHGQARGLRVRVEDIAADDSATLQSACEIDIIEGEGTATIVGPLSAHALINSYKGSIQLGQASTNRAPAEIVGLRVVAPDARLNIEGHLREGDVLAEALLVSGRLVDSQVETRFRCAAQSVEKCSITVTGEVDAGPAITVGKFADLPASVRPLHVDLEDEAAPSPDWACNDEDAVAVRGSDLRCTYDGAIIVGPTEDSSLETHGSIWVHGDLRWSNPGAPQGDALPPPFHVRGRSLWVGGDVESQALLDIEVAAHAFANSISHTRTLNVAGLLLAGALRVLEGSTNLAEVRGDVEGLALKAHRLTVDGTVKSSKLDVTDLAVFRGHIDRQTEIVTRNVVEFHARMLGHLTLRAGQVAQPSRVRLLEDANTIRVEAARAVIEAGRVVVQRLDMAGSVVITDSASLDDPDPRLHFAEVELREDHGTPVLILANSIRTVIDGLRCPSGQARLGASPVPDDERDCVAVKLDGAFPVEVASSRPITFETTPEAQHVQTASLELTGPGPFTLRHTITALNARSDAPAWWPLHSDGHSADLPGVDAPVPHGVPTLQVEATSTVASAHGHIRLRAFTGTLVGAEVSKGRRSTAAAVLLGIEDLGDEGGGRLVGVDPTTLPVEDVTVLRRLSVFDPHPGALHDYATAEATDEVHRHERAQRAQRLSEVVNERATSGNVRSWAFWAAARTRHAVVKGRLERLGRWMHRRMGYGYRPGPAVLTWLGSVLGIGGLAAATEPLVDGVEIDSGAIRSPWYWFAQVARILLLPLSLLRLPELTPDVPGHPYVAQARTDGVMPLLWTWPVAHALAFLVTGVTLSFFVVALKNYLQSPIDR